MTVKKKEQPKKDKGPFTYKFEVSVIAKNKMTEERRDSIINNILRLVQNRETWYSRVCGVMVKDVSDDEIEEENKTLP